MVVCFLNFKLLNVLHMTTFMEKKTSSKKKHTNELIFTYLNILVVIERLTNPDECQGDQHTHIHTKRQTNGHFKKAG